MMEMLNGFEAAHGMNTALILLIIVGLAIVWNFQRDKNNQVDVKDLICTDGRINEAKFMRFSAFLVSTWGFIYLMVDQRFSEWYFAGYMAAWTGNALVNKWLNNREGASPTRSADSPPAPPPPPA